MSKQTVFPCLAFRDAKAQIDWLERALAAEPITVHEDDAGNVVHAEIRIGESLVMAGSVREDGLATPPGQAVVYVVVDDTDALYERAKAAGADVTEPVDLVYGSRDCRVTDPEGNVWAIGTYAGALADPEAANTPVS